MTEKLWDLGACHQKAEHQRIVQDGLIWPELEEVGIVEEFEFIDTDEDPKFFFRSLVTWILDINGTSASALCDTINRIFTDFESKALYTG